MDKRHDMSEVQPLYFESNEITNTWPWKVKDIDNLAENLFPNLFCQLAKNGTSTLRQF